MERTKFRDSIGLVVLLCVSGCLSQQNSLFQQNPYRRQQGLLRQQPFPTPLPPIVTPPTYRGYQQYNPQGFVPITAYQNEINYDGSFAYGYSSGDGTTAQAQGYIKNPGVKDLEAQVVQGSYSYTSPEGTPIRVTYIADENGFRAEGAHIPTPPPIPDAIAKSLQYIASLQPYNQNINPNLNPYQTPLQPFQGQQTLRPGQLNPLQLQKNIYDQQNSGQYQPDNQFPQLQQRPFGQQFQETGTTTIPQHQQQQNLQQQQQKQNIQQQQQRQQQQQQEQQQQNQQQQQLLTQQLQGRPNQIVNPYGYNKYRRFKKSVATTTAAAIKE
ncbi:mediator of RNA polymerase II transcription subunit 12-like [Episyrphus balteatus]|uniref:mediator of RNA polymerase II transcription subunit 12-like n=1 Tax=Episyrphus balteatus TaxID=286459 RepID=UPI00248570C6|nr:mediator of RNA polymerase II transcription subunit 12-like [Episyrphus balteatus]